LTVHREKRLDWKCERGAWKATTNVTEPVSSVVGAEVDLDVVWAAELPDNFADFDRKVKETGPFFVA
jgi:hypothetical protein